MLGQNSGGVKPGVVVLIAILVSIFTSSLVAGAILYRGQQNESSVSFEDSLVNTAIHRTLPAVVSIIVTKDFSDPASATGPDVELLIPNMGGLPQLKGKVKIGGGSGFIVRADGYIVTNRHVVEDAKNEYSVLLHDGRELPARVIGKDPVLDIAVIKVEATDLPVLTPGDSDTLFIGQTVLAIGNSLAQFDNSVTKGIVSGLSRQLTAGDEAGGGEMIEDAIQTDAAINPGNSGGPLLDLMGKVVGVNTAVSRQGQLIGFALPINSVQRIISSAIQNGRIVHPWLGIQYRVINADLKLQLDLPVDHGAYIDIHQPGKESTVLKGGPARAAGVQEGDIILKINNTDIDAQHSLANEIAKYAVGDTIDLLILRSGKQEHIKVKLGEFPRS